MVRAQAGRAGLGVPPAWFSKIREKSLERGDSWILECSSDCTISASSRPGGVQCLGSFGTEPEALSAEDDVFTSDLLDDQALLVVLNL